MKNTPFVLMCCLLCGILSVHLNLVFAGIAMSDERSVTTGEATNITSSSATLNGTISSGRSPSIWFEYGTISGSYDMSTRSVSVVPLGSSEAISIDICGLLLTTTYYYRIAKYDIIPNFYTNNVYGREESFTTLELSSTVTVTPTQPSNFVLTVTTEGATDVLDYATLHGTVNANGLPTQAWFEYGTTSSSYTNSTSKQTICGSSDTAVSNRTNKLPITGSYTFFYRIVAQNNAGTTYGNEKSFIVSAATPTPTPINCNEPELITTSPTELKLKRKQDGEVTVTVKGAADCPVLGKTIDARINRNGSKHISVTPSSQATDENGEAMFTIKAKDKINKAKVTFWLEDFPSIKKSIIVKITR